MEGGGEVQGGVVQGQAVQRGQKGGCGSNNTNWQFVLFESRPLFRPSIIDSPGSDTFVGQTAYS
jgi:hypothetical protein